jgi:tetratricopeptide (TPR) repeat protein
MFSPDLPIPYQAQRTLATLGPELSLFIYDDAESIDSIRDWLPPSGAPCHVVITTIADPWRSGLPTLPIQPLSEAASIDLIRALGGDEVAQAYGNKLAESAGGLPMQIVPAARMLRHERDKGQLSSAQLTLTAEAERSFQGVYTRLDADSQLLLHAALQFNPQRILRDELSFHLQQGAYWLADRFKKSLDTCSDLHLVEGADNLRMHQLFAAFLRQSTVPPELNQHLREIRKIQAQRFVQYARQVGDKPVDAEAVSRFLAFPADLPSWEESALLGSDSHAIGYALFELRRFQDAQPWFERAIALKEQPDSQGRIDHASLGASLHMIGSCLLFTGHPAEAKPWFERAAKESAQGDLSGKVNHASLGQS